jgi:hypothetical protein
LTAVAPVTVAAAFCVTLPLPAAVLIVRLDALIAFSASALASVTETAPPETPIAREVVAALVERHRAAAGGDRRRAADDRRPTA